MDENCFITLAPDCSKRTSLMQSKADRGRSFSCERPFYERAVSDLDRPMNISLWV
jgi:hypothetical protein